MKINEWKQKIKMHSEEHTILKPSYMVCFREERPEVRSELMNIIVGQKMPTSGHFRSGVDNANSEGLRDHLCSSASVRRAEGKDGE